jgi:hypothetical protein
MKFLIEADQVNFVFYENFTFKILKISAYVLTHLKVIYMRWYVADRGSDLTRKVFRMITNP